MQVSAGRERIVQVGPPGSLRVTPDGAGLFSLWGLTTPEAFLDLPGIILSGHTDRHVLRVQLPDGRVGYLKREHRVPWRTRFKHWMEGFGWASKSERERILLDELSASHLHAPRWLACGEDRLGRAFLLIDGERAYVDLPSLLQRVTPHEREIVLTAVARHLARVHGSGFRHRDLVAKHVLIEPASDAICLIDWQRGYRTRLVSWKHRCQELSRLYASLAGDLVPAELFTHLVRVYLREVGKKAGALPHLPTFLQTLEESAGRERPRYQHLGRHIPEQPLEWLDGEAICVAPSFRREIEHPELWQHLQPGPTWLKVQTRKLVLPISGIPAQLTRRVTRLNWSRGWCWLRDRRWRSPELQQARLLFHLERHGILAPTLISFGQRQVGQLVYSYLLFLNSMTPCGIEQACPQQLAQLLYQLHVANVLLRPERNTQQLLGIEGDRLGIAQLTSLQRGRRTSHAQRQADLRCVLRCLGPDRAKRCSAAYESARKGAQA